MAAYSYQTQRHWVFTENGQVMFLKIRDEAKRLLDQSGAVMSGKLLIGSGDVWNMLACIDRLVELKELIELPQERCAGQHRVFIGPWNPG